MNVVYGRDTVVFRKRTGFQQGNISSRSSGRRDTRNDHGQRNKDTPSPLVPHDLSPRGGPTTTTISRSCRGDGTSLPGAYNTRGLWRGQLRLGHQPYLRRRN